MSAHPTDPRTAILEARVAELERTLASLRVRHAPKKPMRPTLRLAFLVLAAALILPAGAVLASHQFNDVPTSYQFHNAIDAIADAGITTGCGGGKYCPSGLVTRGQMAAFLSRLGALQPGSVPKVNADRVDGFHGGQLLLGTGTIPPGTTITGFNTWDEVLVADNHLYVWTEHFPARAPQNLIFSDVNFAPHDLAIEDDPTCTGTLGAPTAPPGKVCLYLGLTSHVTNVSGGAAIQLPGFADRGFVVQWISDGLPGDDMFIRYSWAYTAPSI